MFHKTIISDTVQEIDKVNLKGSGLLNSTINILVVDDEPAMLKNLVSAIEDLEKTGIIPKISIKTAVDGVEALDLIEEGIKTGWKVDIVFSDIDMPRMSGKDLCEYIRTDKSFEEVKTAPFIFISGYAKDSEKQLAAMKLGADKVYAKPFDTGKLPLIFLELLRLREERAESGLYKKALNFISKKPLIEKIIADGKVDESYYDHYVGIVFGDIVNYTEISQKLSSEEAGILVNSILYLVYDFIDKYQGLYNKSMADGFMFQFGDPLDKTLPAEKREEEIARRIFYTCVEIQQALHKFNLHSYESPRPNAQAVINTAYNILRQKFHEGQLITIKVRLGAHMGNVNIGYFGPEESKQYDAIGANANLPSRFETSAPPGGIRISTEVFKHLEASGETKKYEENFRSKAIGLYKDIPTADLFNFKKVQVKGYKEKQPSYSVQIFPNLPEMVSQELENMLDLGEKYIPEIVDTIRLYRGNRYVLNAVEKLFEARNIKFSKLDIYRIIQPKAFEKIKNNPQDCAGLEKKSLYALLNLINQLQDKYQAMEQEDSAVKKITFTGQLEYLQAKEAEIENKALKKQEIDQLNNRIYDLLIPKISACLEAGLFEYFRRKK